MVLCSHPRPDTTTPSLRCQSMFTLDQINRFIGSVDCCPWGAAAGCRETRMAQTSPLRGRPLYMADERRRRDASIWTLVQGVLAPVQFVVALIGFRGGDPGTGLAPRRHQNFPL